MRLFKFLLITFSTIALAFPVMAKEHATSQVLFKNVNVFDGKSDKLAKGQEVLVEGNLIKKIGRNIDARNATVVDGGGRTLTPGFIDNHVHLMLPGPTLPSMEANSTWEDLAIAGVAAAKMYLMQGFTTVRDAGGQNGGLQRAINAGAVTGPRIYPSAAFLGTRGGHADFANYTSPVGESSNFSRLNMAQEVDSVADIQKFGRNNFRMGASQLKFMQWQLRDGTLLQKRGHHDRAECRCPFNRTRLYVRLRNFRIDEGKECLYHNQPDGIRS
jgi:imidazolonepropionase-like amidohydrolase